MVLTEQERDAFEKWRRAPKTRKVKVSRVEDHTSLEPDHPIKAVGFALLLESLGTTDQDFLNGLLKEIAALTSVDGEIDEGQLNFMLSIVGGVKPQDQVESLLAAHIAAVHIVSMRFAERVLNTMSVPDRESSQQAFDKSTRTLVTLVEALKRHRCGGEQKVIVQHVNVGEGGQAIVSNVTQGQTEGQPEKTAAAAAPLLTDGKPLPMQTIDVSRTKRRVTARRGTRR
jgi:hypothetical protein